MDLSEQIHRGIYGRSDRANAPENRGADFQAGFMAGSKLEGEPLNEQTAEWARRGCPLDQAGWAAYQEWKRGMWAARMQKTISQITV